MQTVPAAKKQLQVFECPELLSLRHLTCLQVNNCMMHEWGSLYFSLTFCVWNFPY